GLGEGRSISTECVATGMVMMNMMRSTSMTSISGVVFISIIGSPSSVPPDIAIADYSLFFALPSAVGIDRVRNEPDGRVSGPLHIVARPGHTAPRCVDVAADMGLRNHFRILQDRVDPAFALDDGIEPFKGPVIQLFRR